MRRIVTTLGLSLGLAASLLGVPVASAAPADAGTVIVQLDNPSQGEQNLNPNWIAGWAIDTAATSGTGITSVAVYLDGDAGSGRFLGQATYGGDRNDVAAQFGNPNFRYSGYTFNLAGMNIAPGTQHSFTVVATSAASGTASATASNVTLAPQSNPAYGYGYGTQGTPGYGMQGPPPPPSGAYGQSTSYGTQPPYGPGYGMSASDANGLPIIGNGPYNTPIQPVYTPTYQGNYYGYGNGYGYGYGSGYGYGMSPYYAGGYNYGYGMSPYGWNGYYNNYKPSPYYGYGSYPWGYPGYTLPYVP